MSLSKFLCTNRGEVHTLFRKLRDWKIDVKNFSLEAERDGLTIYMSLVGPPVVVYHYKGSLVSISVDKEEKERVISKQGDVDMIQRKLDSLLK